MTKHFTFFKTSMPKTRMAEYYIGCLDGSVYLDFNVTSDGHVYLVRISFDGYGCCTLHEASIPMTKEDSRLFIENCKGDLNQEIMTAVITRIIKANKDSLWEDTLQEYGFID